MASGTDDRPAGDRLRAWRTGRGLSQGEAARQIDVRQATWCGWESSDVRRGPNRDLAIRLEALTGGAVPIESWSRDPRVAEDMETVVRRRAASVTTARRTNPELSEGDDHDHDPADSVH